MPRVTNREILIVEDNPADVRLIREALNGLEPGVNIHVASDGDEALQLLRGQGTCQAVPKPSLIFLDFHLPRSSSRDLLKHIKDDESLKLIPVAVLTTSDVDRDIQQAYELRANCYLRKPPDLERFLGTIQAAARFWLDIAESP